MNCRLSVFKFVFFTATLVRFFLGESLTAQESTSELYSYTIDDGLSQNLVFSITQDSIGFMWMGTKNGLNRFDGHKFKVYKSSPKDSTKLYNGYVTYLGHDEDGTLWAGTLPGGLHRFDHRFERFSRLALDSLVPSFFYEAQFWQVAGGEKTGWWLFSNSGMAYLPSSGNIHQAKTPQGIARYAKGMVIQKGTGLRITVSRNRLFILDAEENTPTFTQWSDGTAWGFSEKETARYLLPAYDGSIWITTTNGLWRVEADGSRWERIPLSVTETELSFINHIVLTDKNSIWINCGNAIVELDATLKREKQVFRVSNPISLYADRSGVLWIGTSGWGIFRYDPKQQRFGLQKGNFQNLVFPKFDVLAKRYHGIEVPNPRTEKTAIIEDRFNSGLFWIGLRNAGLYLYDSVKHEVVQKLQQPSKDIRTLDLNALFQDKNGKVYVGVNQGYIELDPVTGKSTLTSLFTYSNMINDLYRMVAERITSVWADSGSVWVGTSNFGVVSKQKATGEIKQYNLSSRDDFPTNFVLSITEDPIVKDSVLWFGTDGAGLLRLDRRTDEIRVFSTETGFPNDVVYSALHGTDGNLWCSTNAGLIRLNPQTYEMHVFDRFDGLQSNEFNRQQFLRFNNGKLLFGGLYGINSFFPDEIRANPYVPKTVFTGFLLLNEDASFNSATAVFNQSLNYQHHITFPWEKNTMTIQFAALEYSAPEKNTIKYRLIGFDENWKSAGRERAAFYTNLNPGNYVFEAVSANNDGIWSNEKARLSIVITPPWWMKTEVRILVLLMILTFFGGLIWYQSRKKHQKEMRELEYKLKLDEEKLRISRDMHDSLGSRLTQIKIMSELLMREPEQHRLDLFDSLSSASAEVIEQCSQLVWSLNPEHDSLESLVDYMVRYTNDYVTKSGLRCRIHIPEFLPAVQIHSQVRNQVLMSLKEALHNAIKYAGCEEITLRISIQSTEKSIKFEIQDDGIGFDETALKRVGNGLKNMRERLKEIGGNTEIQSKPGEGTSVIFTLNLPLDSKV